MSALFWMTLAGAASAEEAAPPPWETLRAAYSYTPAEPPGRLPDLREARRPDPELAQWGLSFTKPRGQKVTGVFLRPRAEGVYPCAVLLHGLTSDKETMAQLFGRPLAQRGIASLSLDAHLHGERAVPGRSPRADGMEFVQMVREGIVDYRHALDYLATREDVDPRRVGLLGYSMGAMMGAILAAVDSRVRAAAMLVGGDFFHGHLSSFPPQIRSVLETISPAYYLPHVSPRPVFLMNGRLDTVVPESAGKALHAAARQPNELHWVEAGHMLPPEAAVRSLDWLVERLL